MQRDELLNQLKSQSLEAVSPTAFRQVGNPVFPDAGALTSLEAFGHIVEAFRHVHLPAYGQPIPRSSAVSSVNNDGDLLTASNNEVKRVLVVEITNSSTDPATADLRLNGILVAQMTADPNATTAVQGLPDLWVDSLSPLSVANSSSSLTVSCSSVLVAQ